ncbi:thiamine pyrophosphate-dependent enzyme (plasmid) [Pseudalkalibacillus hwajinpoensis]|uniref:thiamine pyrophosphate-dependent enzyme n=1 Tax=Guptibacillus hwajinpoensis TaxID=208199 RepID=UPI00325C2119
MTEEKQSNPCLLLGRKKLPQEKETIASSVTGEPGGLSAKIAIHAIRSSLPSETIFFGDDGSHSFYAIKHLDIFQAGTFFFDDVFGSMGHAIGYAIGAKLRQPERPIICLTGDGCFYMHGTEVATAVDLNLPLLFIVFNNNQLDMVDKGMKQWFGSSVGASYSVGLEVARFSRALGSRAYRCETAMEIKEAIHEALFVEGGPTVVEVMVDPNEIPPTLNRV